jgi:hypothetical protein
MGQQRWQNLWRIHTACMNIGYISILSLTTTSMKPTTPLVVVKERIDIWILKCIQKALSHNLSQTWISIVRWPNSKGNENCQQKNRRLKQGAAGVRGETRTKRAETGVNHSNSFFKVQWLSTCPNTKISYSLHQFLTGHIGQLNIELCTELLSKIHM